MGFGGPHAAFLAAQGRVPAPDAGPHHRRVARRQGQARVPPGAADPRAAHPPREGDAQHLHRAGAARGDGVDVRRLSRPRGPRARSRERVRGVHRGRRRRASRGSATASRAGALLRHAARRPRRARAGRACSRARSSAGSTCAATTTASASRSTRRPRPPTSHDAARGVRAAARAAVRRRRARRATDVAGAAGARSRARRAFLTHPMFHRYHSEHEMLRYINAAGGEGPVAHARR